MRPTTLNAAHFSFREYVHQARWASFWHQIEEVLSREIATVLEVGGGAGVVASLLKSLGGLQVVSVDVNRNLEPDYVASVEDLPFADQSQDCVCAFQVLEHLPYENALQGLREMVRVSRRWVIISLPDAKPLYRYSLSVLKILRLTLHIPGRFFLNKKHVQGGTHCWELNTWEHPLRAFLADIARQNPETRLDKSYRCPSNPYHRFIILERAQGQEATP